MSHSPGLSEYDTDVRCGEFIRSPRSDGKTVKVDRESFLFRNLEEEVAPGFLDGPFSPENLRNVTSLNLPLLQARWLPSEHLHR